MDIEDLSVLGLYCQNENKVPATLLQLINRTGGGNFAPLDIK